MLTSATPRSTAPGAVPGYQLCSSQSNTSSTGCRRADKVKRSKPNKRNSELAEGAYADADSAWTHICCSRQNPGKEILPHILLAPLRPDHLAAYRPLAKSRHFEGKMRVLLVKAGYATTTRPQRLLVQVRKGAPRGQGASLLLRGLHRRSRGIPHHGCIPARTCHAPPASHSAAWHSAA